MRTARSSSRPGGSTPGTPLWEQALPGSRYAPRPGTPLCGQTHACKHITLPQTSFAGSKNTCIEGHPT